MILEIIFIASHYRKTNSKNKTSIDLSNYLSRKFDLLRKTIYINSISYWLGIIIRIISKFTKSFSSSY